MNTIDPNKSGNDKRSGKVSSNERIYRKNVIKKMETKNNIWYFFI